MLCFSLDFLTFQWQHIKSSLPWQSFLFFSSPFSFISILSFFLFIFLRFCLPIVLMESKMANKCIPLNWGLRVTFPTGPAGPCAAENQPRQAGNQREPNRETPAFRPQSGADVQRGPVQCARLCPLPPPLQSSHAPAGGRRAVRIPLWGRLPGKKVENIHGYL